MSRLTVWNVRDVALNVFGIPIDDGGAEDFVTVSYDGPLFEVIKGASGDVVRAANNERMISITVSLLQTSKHNAQFSAIMAADDIATNGAGVGVFLLKDTKGSTLITSAECWIHEAPEYKVSKGVNVTEWKLMAKLENAAQYVIGGR